jgi:phosphonate degradation associated HDIG domain protein
MTMFDDLVSLYVCRGAAVYFGEAVTMMEHALQAAYFARQHGASDALVIAALLHDVGHLIEPAPDDIADWKTDAAHERTGGQWLCERFGAQISEPVRLHVPAKRYLCATDPAYFRRLSDASVVTLKLQGGPMSPAEVASFRSEPGHRDAVLLRQWDDQGKIAGLKTPSFESYRAMIEKLAALRSA